MSGPRPGILNGEAREALAALPVSAAVKAGLQRYFEEGIPTGHFLRAVLENNLHRALERADLENRQLLIPIAGWLQTYPPGSAWGSKDQVSAWLEAGALSRPGTFEVTVRLRMKIRGDDGEKAKQEALEILGRQLLTDRYEVEPLGATVLPEGGGL